MVCEIDPDALGRRGHDICKMLIPLVGPSRVAYKIVSHRSEVVIGVHSGSPPDDRPTEWRFSTIVQGIRAGYHERWMATDEKRKRFYMERSYLHLYRRRLNESEEREMIALHCDPNEPDDSGLRKHATYKRGPHIHVTASDQPLPHSHIALNLCEVHEVLSSITSLHAAVSSGVVLLRDQVLDLIDSYGM